MDKAKCRDCSKTKIRVASGTNRRGETLYKDDKQRLWNWNQCPDCWRVYSQKRYRAKVLHKAPKIVEEAAEVEMDPLTHRKCTECNNRLPRSRYFRHKECEDKFHASEGQGFYSAEDWGYGVSISASESLNFKISEMHLLGAQ